MNDSVCINENTSQSFFSFQQKEDQDHLIDWVVNLCYEQGNIPPNITIKSIYLSHALPYIIHQMCPEQFALQLPMSQVEGLFIDYFFKEYGFYVKPLLSLEGKKQAMMIKLVLYACIYSQQKQKFVSNILKLPGEAQQKIVTEIQRVQTQLKQLKNWDRMIQIMKQLQAENNQLTDLLNKAEQKFEQYQQKIKKINQQLEQTKKQRNCYIVQKRKLLSGYELSSLAQYEDLCAKLQNQNQQLSGKEKQLLEIVKQLEEENYQLHRQLNDNSCVISNLNKQYSTLQKSYFEMTKELSTFQESNFFDEIRSQDMKNTNMSQHTVTADMLNSKRGSKTHKKKPSGLQNLANDILQKTQQNFGKGRSGRSSARNLFNTTKNIVLLNQKIMEYDEQIQQQNHRLLQLENQIINYQHKQKYYLKKLRKVQRLSDGFSMQYENIADGRFKIVHFNQSVKVLSQ